MAETRRSDRSRSGMANRAIWDRYVASVPSWREIEACGGVCDHAPVCGRARICVRDERVPACVTYALARLSARLAERPPARRLTSPL